MITVQDAVLKVLEFYESLPSKQKPLALLVEEVEFSDKEKCYFITLGYNTLDSQGGKNPLTAVFGETPTYRREYKIFKVDVDTGKVLYMKIRRL